MVSKRMFFILSLAMSFFVNGQLCAQTLTDAQRVEIQNRVKQKIEEFQTSLAIITNPALSPKTRKEHVDLILKLFIGEGEPYDFYDLEDDRLIHSTGARIETIRKGRTSHSQKVKDFIYKLYNPETNTSRMRLPSAMRVEASSVVFVEDVQRIGDHYECTAIYYSNLKYSKKRKIRIRINSIEIPNGEIVWDLKLDGICLILEK